MYFPTFTSTPVFLGFNIQTQNLSKNKKRDTRQLLSLKFISGHNFKIKSILDLAIICKLLVVVKS